MKAFLRDNCKDKQDFLSHQPATDKRFFISFFYLANLICSIRGDRKVTQRIAVCDQRSSLPYCFFMQVYHIIFYIIWYLDRQDTPHPIFGYKIILRQVLVNYKWVHQFWLQSFNDKRYKTTYINQSWLFVVGIITWGEEVGYGNVPAIKVEKDRDQCIHNSECTRRLMILPSFRGCDEAQTPETSVSESGRVEWIWNKESERREVTQRSRRGFTNQSARYFTTMHPPLDLQPVCVYPELTRASNDWRYRVTWSPERPLLQSWSLWGGGSGSLPKGRSSLQGLILNMCT